MRIRNVAGLLAGVLLCFRAQGHSDLASRFGVGDAFPNDPPALIEQRLALYREAGIGILRVDVDWRTQEVRDGAWQDTPNLALLQQGQRGGFRFKANIGSITSPPKWFFQEHADAQLKNQDGLLSFHDISYWYPGLHALLREKDDRLFASLSRLGLLEAIEYLVVPLGPAGESLYPAPWTTTAPDAPMRFWFYDDNAQADFPRRMQAKYGTLEAANKAWGTRFTQWQTVTIPLPGTHPGTLWQDVLEWYRDAKRDFTRWQIEHYRELRARYFRTDHAPQLLLLVPGNHISANEWRQGIDAGDGGERLKLMSDSEFLLKEAHQSGAVTQYTGLPNLREIEYLQSYTHRRGYRLKWWGENAGNAGEPRELDAEVFLNGLVGSEYIGSNLFAADHVTPTPRYAALKAAHAWLADTWAGRTPPHTTFDTLPIAQGTCVHADGGQTISLCMQDDANLVLRNGVRTVWASHTAHSERNFCSTDESPAAACDAVFQGDGNLVVSRGTQPLWASGTSLRGRYLVFSDKSPFLSIVGHDGQVIWTATPR